MSYINIGKVIFNKNETSDYIQQDPILKDGEFCISKNSDTGRYEFRIGDGIHKFSELDKLVDNYTIASPTQLGMIKLLADGDGENRSGIVVDPQTGVAYINAKQERGIYRDGAGQIFIEPATQAEVEAGTEHYKPITPETLRSNVYIKSETDDKYAPKISPIFTGTPSAPTASLDTNDTQIATTEFVTNVVNDKNIYKQFVEQIGKWIDGTPIWRAIFSLTNSELLEKIPTLWTDRSIGFKDLVEVQNLTEVYIITNYAIYASNGTPSIVDSRKLEYSGSMYFDFSDNMTEGTCDMFYGFIEFATPANNIIIDKFIKDYKTMTSEQGQDEIIDWEFVNPSGDSGTKSKSFVDNEGIKYSHATRNASSYVTTNVGNLDGEITISGTWNTGHSSSAIGNKTYLSYVDENNNIIFSLGSSYNDKKIYLECGQNKVIVWDNVRDTICTNADVNFSFTYNTKTKRLYNVTITSSELQYNLQQDMYSTASELSFIRMGADMSGNDPKIRVTMDCTLKNVDISSSPIAKF